MKNFLLLLVLFLSHSYIAGSAQVVVAQSLLVNGYAVNGFMNDSTMSTAAWDLIPSSNAVKKYIHDSIVTHDGTVTTVIAGSGLSGGVITTSGTISMPSVGTAATYNGSFTTDAQGRVSSAHNASIDNSPGRYISTTGSNNTFTISASYNARVYYTLNFAAALTLATSNGAVSLDYSTNSGSTWTSVASVSQVFGASVTINTNQDMVLCGEIPANALVRIYQTANTRCTITLSKQQEVTY